MRSKRIKQLLALFYDHSTLHKICIKSSNPDTKFDTIEHRFTYTALDKTGQKYALASSMSKAAEVYTTPTECAILPS